MQDAQLKALLGWHRLPVWDWVVVGTRGARWDCNGKLCSDKNVKEVESTGIVQLWEGIKEMKKKLVGLWREDRAEEKFVIEGRRGSPQYFSLLEMVVSNPI